MNKVNEQFALGDYVNFITDYFTPKSTESAIWRIIETGEDSVLLEPVFFFVKPNEINGTGSTEYKRWALWHQVRHVDIVDLATTRLQIDQLITEIIRKRSC